MRAVNHDHNLMDDVENVLCALRNAGFIDNASNGAGLQSNGDYLVFDGANHKNALTLDWEAMKKLSFEAGKLSEIMKLRARKKTD